MDNQFILAMYLRISSNNEQYGDSQSITGQRDLINEYIQTHDELKKAHVIEFSDDGYSGTNFERPSIIKLLEKAKRGEINAIIVKDFSRFGRNYIDVGDYIEQIFPFLNVRFISVNDCFDSATQQNSADIGIAFKHLCDDYYCKDLSRKIKANVRTAWESGKNLSLGFYGYKRNPMDKYQLIIDEETSSVVRFIFQKAILGISSPQIAVALNKKGILTPLAHSIKKKGAVSENKLKRVWKGETTLNIIRDLRYTGLLIQGMNAAQPEFIIYEKKLEAIVTREEFEKAQGCIVKKRKYKKNKPKSRHAFPVKIRCSDCGHAMTRLSERSKKYFCPYARVMPDNPCLTGKIGIDKLRNIALSSIQQFYNLIEREAKGKYVISSVNLLRKIQSLEKELSSISNSKLILYNKYSDGKISYDKYLIEQGEANKESKDLIIQIDTLKKDAIIIGEKILNLQWKY